MILFYYLYLNRGISQNNATNCLMNTTDAIIKRINEICQQKGYNVCKACVQSGKSPSALYDLLKGRTKCPKVTTVKSFCEGAGITLAEFFSTDYFNDLEDDE